MNANLTNHANGMSKQLDDLLKNPPQPGQPFGDWICEVEELLQKMRPNFTFDQIRMYIVQHLERYGRKITDSRVVAHLHNGPPVSAQTNGVHQQSDTQKRTMRTTTPHQSDGQSQAAPPSFSWQTSPEPWPHTVDGQALLNEMIECFNRYLVLPDHSALALSLWVLHSYSWHLGRRASYVALLSPEKRCGKTTALEVIAELAHRTLNTSNISPAGIYRVIEKYHPTLVIDESDSFIKNNEELRGIINAGTTKAGHVVRVVGEGTKQDVQPFSCFGPKVLAGIGSLPGTIEDRAIIIRMRRKLPSDHVERLRSFDGSVIRQKCMRFIHDHQGQIAHAVPSLPEELNDRAADTWEPLLALADLIGGSFPEMARSTAVVLSHAKDDDSINVKLLADIRLMLRAQELHRIPTRALLDHLIGLEERPWGTLNRGLPMTARQLSDRLRNFGIHSRDIRFDDRKGKGYMAQDFADPFTRYLPADIRDNETIANNQ